MTIPAFSERAEGAFRNMFELLIGRVGSGAEDIAAYELGPPRDEAIKLLDRLQKCPAEKLANTVVRIAHFASSLPRI